MESKIVQPWMKGLILSLITIIYGIVLYLMDLYQNQTLGYINHIIILAGIIWSCIHYAKQMNGNVSFGNVFAYGFKVTAAIIVITVIYTIISIKFIFPEMMDKMLEISAKQMETEKKLTDDQIKKALDFLRNYMLPLAIGTILFGYGIIGAIASAIGAGVAKKNPISPFEQ